MIQHLFASLALLLATYSSPVHATVLTGCIITVCNDGPTDKLMAGGTYGSQWWWYESALPAGGCTKVSSSMLGEYKTFVKPYARHINYQYVGNTVAGPDQIPCGYVWRLCSFKVYNNSGQTIYATGTWFEISLP